MGGAGCLWRRVVDNGCELSKQGHVCRTLQASCELVQSLAHRLGRVQQKVRFTGMGCAAGDMVKCMLNAARH